MITDPVADMLTIIRNACSKKHSLTTFFFSKLKWNVCQKLLENNYIGKLEKKGNKIVVDLVYKNRSPKIKLIKKISTPSQHFHYKFEEIKKKFFLSRKETFIFSTSLGLLTNKETIEKKQGGKLLLSIL